MKLKLFFLGMVAAALMIGCNNEIAGPNNGQNGDLPPEGLPVYTSLNFKVFSGSTAKTYAGELEVPASADELVVSDGAMYIYRFNGTPETYVYISNIDGGTGNRLVTLKATSGVKRIYVAVNIDQTSARLVPTTGTLGIFDALNNPLFSTNTTQGWGLAAQTTPDYIKADGLIGGLAMGDIYGTGDDLVGADPYSGSNAMLMTNWDGPDDYADVVPPPASIFASNCIFTLFPAIDSIDSHDATGSQIVRDSSNNFDINVQRAFSKISLAISVAQGNNRTADKTSGNFADTFFVAGTGINAGEFQPWSDNDGGVSVWSLGNIHKETLPFQHFVGTYLRDLNYAETNDSILNTFANWTIRYDNTRIFPFGQALTGGGTINSYPHDSILVANVKARMLMSNNFIPLTDLNSTPQAYNFAYAIENAREIPVPHDFGTFVLLGGRYNPASIIVDLNRGIPGSTPQLIPEAWRDILATDTVYYVQADKQFILGKMNLLKYFAWKLSKQPAADPDGSYGAAVPIDQALIDEVNDAIATVNDKDGNKDVYAYIGGQCWYRIFIQDTKANPNEEFVVRRNHIYSVNITKFNGPGIDDPNQILLPGEPIGDIQTFVTANITAVPWHQVNQDQEVGF